MRVVRKRASQWGVDEKKIGVMGFSAGGEIAAMASARFDVEGGVSSRPDFQALIYPGVKPGMIEFPKDAPPAFLLCADNDQGPSIGIASMYQSLKKAGVPTEIHIYETGGYGFGVREGAKTLVAKTWMDRLADWMRGPVCLAEGLVGEDFEALGGRLDEGWALDEPDSDELGFAIDPEVSAGGTAPSEFPIDG